MNQTQQAYSDWLQDKQWSYFATITYRTIHTNPYHAINSLHQSYSSLGVSKAFTAIEPHQSGELHAHALLSFYNQPWDDVPEPSPSLLWNHFFKRYGRSKVENVRSGEDVANYCAKYCTKNYFHYDVYGGASAWNA